MNCYTVVIEHDCLSYLVTFIMGYVLMKCVVLILTKLYGVYPNCKKLPLNL